MFLALLCSNSGRSRRETGFDLVLERKRPKLNICRNIDVAFATVTDYLPLQLEQLSSGA